MNRLNKTFVAHEVAHASDMNEVVGKINEIVDAKLDTSHNFSNTAHQALFNSKVGITDNQTIAGRKTFTGTIILDEAYSESRGNSLIVNSENEITPDENPHIRYMGDVQTYESLPAPSTLRVGDMYHIVSTGEDYYAREVTRNQKITVEIRSASNLSTRLSSTDIDLSVYEPLEPEDFYQLMSSATWSASYPEVAASGISDNVSVISDLHLDGTRVCFVPIAIPNYGTIIAFVGYQKPTDTRKAWALGGDDSNVYIWQSHIHNQGEIVDITQYYPSAIISTGNIQTFQPIGNHVTWESLGVKSSTLAGYGITDAYISNGVITLGNESVPAKLDFEEGDTGTDMDLSTSFVSYAPQGKTQAQKAQARENIGALGEEDIPPLDFEISDSGTEIEPSDSYVSYAPQSMTSAQKEQARENIGAASETELEGISAAVVTINDSQTITGVKTFQGAVNFTNELNSASFSGLTTISGQLKYSKKNASAESIEEGLLARDNLGNVFSILLKTINGQSIIGNGNITIESGGGGAQVQSDWNETDISSLAYIQNKPTIPSAQVQSNWNESDNTSKAYILNKPTIPEFVDVSSMFASNPELPSGYTMAQLQTKSLYAVVGGNRFPVTLKYSSSTHKGRFFYVDFDGTTVSCEDSPVSFGERVYVSGRLLTTAGTPISDYTLHFIPSQTSLEGITFNTRDVYIYPDANGNFTADLFTGMTYTVKGSNASIVLATIDHPYFTTDAVTGFDITM